MVISNQSTMLSYVGVDYIVYNTSVNFALLFKFKLLHYVGLTITLQWGFFPQVLKNITIHIGDENEAPCIIDLDPYTHINNDSNILPDIQCSDSDTLEWYVEETQRHNIGFIHVYDPDNNEDLIVDLLHPWFDVGDVHCREEEVRAFLFVCLLVGFFLVFF